MDTGVLLGFVSIIIGVLVGWGANMLVPPHEEFRVARWCFIVGAAIWCFMGIYWGVMSDQPFWLRALIVGAFGASGAIATMHALSIVRGREVAVTAPALSPYANRLRPSSLSRPIAYEPAGVSTNNGIVTAFKFGVVNNDITMMRVNVVSGELRIVNEVVGRIKGWRPAFIGQGQKAFWQIAAT